MVKVNKTILILGLIAATSFFGVQAKEDHIKAKASKDDHIKFGIAMMYDKGDSSFGIGLALKNALLEAGINARAGRSHANASFSDGSVGGYTGLRYSLKDKIIGSAGIMGNCANHPYGYSHTPYTIGAYVGLSYEPSDSIQIFARIMPFSYKRLRITHYERYGFFEEGQIGLAFFF
jgi:hypothetical protein